MPTYVYRCKSCQGEEEVQARMSDAAPVRLSSCREGQNCELFKVMQPFAKTNAHGGDTPELVSTGRDKTPEERHVCSSNCPVHKLIHKAV